MKAITVSDREAGAASLALTELPRPEAATNDVVVRVHAASFIHTELDWPDTWTDRAGRPHTERPRPCVSGSWLSWVTARPDSVSASGCSGFDRLVAQRLAGGVHRGGSPQSGTVADRHRSHRGGRTADFRADRLAGLIRSRPSHQWTNGFDPRCRGCGRVHRGAARPRSRRARHRHRPHRRSGQGGRAWCAHIRGPRHRKTGRRR